MTDNAFWAAIFTLTLVPFGIIMGFRNFGPGILGRIAGIWIGGVAGFLAIQPLFGFATLPLREAWAEFQRLADPFNPIRWLAIVLLMTPGVVLLWVQGRINQRRESRADQELKS